MTRIPLHDGWVDARTGEVHRGSPCGTLCQKARALLVRGLLGGPRYTDAVLSSCSFEVRLMERLVDWRSQR